MNTFLLNISSPDGKVFSGNVTCIIVRGAAGDLAVMAGHIPFITSVKEGSCAVHFEDGTVKNARTTGGLLSVASTEVTFMTSGLDWE